MQEPITTEWKETNVCSAAVCLWILSIRDNNIDFANTLQLVDAQRLQTLLDTNNPSLLEYLESQHLTTAGGVELRAPQPVETAFQEQIEALNFGHCYFLQLATMNCEGHAMGIYCSGPQAYSLFEPRRGVYANKDITSVMRILNEGSFFTRYCSYALVPYQLK